MSETVLKPHQWEVIQAFADIAVPSIPLNANAVSSVCQLPAVSQEDGTTPGNSDSGNPRASPSTYAEQYLEESLSSLDGFQDFIERVFGQYIHPEGRKGILFILDALSSRAGSLLLTGSATPIHRQPDKARERIFQGMRNSRLPPVRLVSRVLILIFKRAWTTLSPSMPALLGLSTATSVHLKRAEGAHYEFLQFPAATAADGEEEPASIDTDIVIVGSGCGGSVAAKNLADAGYRVVVVEKSYNFPTSAFPMTPLAGNANLYENGGFLATDDGNMAVLAGSSWGGGGTINWSASLAPQGYLREEWSTKHGLEMFTSRGFQECVERVCERMGVDDSMIEHSFGNQLVLSAAQKLGYNAKPVPQNTGNGKHYCGHCHLGCASAMKKGPRETFLADAAQSGAVFIEGFDVHKVILGPRTRRAGANATAIGIEGTWTSRAFHFGENQESGPRVRRRVEIRSKRVIVACGSLQSPLLLRRSGLRNPHIGRHLYLHPVLASVAVFDRDVHPWEGSALTTVISDWENVDGHGHGIKIETPAMLPSTVLPLLPWHSGAEFKVLASKMGRMAGFISLCRDRDSGRVYPDPTDGRCRIEYTTSNFDKQHLIEGLIACAKMAHVSGATEYHTTSSQIPPLLMRSSGEEDSSPSQGGLNDPALQNWISTVRSLAPLNNEKAVFASAHQMGTCRMGTSPRHSVVDPDAQVWGVDGLYVCDASVFPSASGANPMVTNMAIADWTSRRIAVILREEMTANLRGNL
ncbi:GMC oxidoreductase [Aspergillus pseudoustus]|uniref:Long-chain-alcohol oxidase n=1 Tax=Aspergillus pseudoustus TaxID=1810923 RepID=A0ABR4IKR7_9EURO